MSSIPRDDRPSQPDTNDETVILGIDTHKDFHVAFVISAQGNSLGHRIFATTATGYQQLLDWASGFGKLKRAGVEGTSSYGIAVTRVLRAAGVVVLEVNRSDKANRRRRGKTDVIDAETAARAVLAGRATAVAKTGDGPAEVLRMLEMAKDSAIKSRSQAINHLKAVIVRANPALREALTGLSNARLVRRCADLDCSAPTTSVGAAAYTLRSLARRILALTGEIDDLKTHIAAAIATSHPALLDCYGVGPDTAAALLIAAGDNPDRLRSEASFAALCGVSPIEASSGKTIRRRLNRGGDRQANSALYTVVVARLRWDTAIKSYIARREADGKSRREAIRCLKRYIARELYRIITESQPGPAATALLTAA
ncbi:IS110 family transposase [Nocardia africana]|uniref:IS110 family transposase n=1 Tax=Nocardia africana TaxID=134964 RepID=A0ABW6NVF3_9NOCA